MNIKLFSCLVFLVVTVSATQAQSVSFSLNVNTFSSFTSSSIPQNNSVINPEIGISASVYKAILSKADAFAELGYANLGVTKQSINSGKNSGPYIEVKEIAPSLFFALGVNKKWSKISLGVAPMLVYKLKSTIYFSDYDWALVNERNDKNDYFQYGLGISSQILILEGKDVNSIWLKPYFTYQQFVNSDYNNLFIGKTSTAGLGFVYRFSN